MNFDPNAKQAAESKKSKWILLLAVSFCYLYFFPYFAKLNSPAENSRLYMVKAIAEHGTFAINDVFGGEYGYVVDLAKRGDKFYSIKAPGTSFLGVLFFYPASLIFDMSKRTETYLLRLFTSIIPSLIFLFFFFGFLGRISKNIFNRDLVFIGLALGSMFFTYGILLFGHQQAAIGLAGGFMLFFENKRRDKDSIFYIILGGLLIAFSVACEYQAFFAAIFLCAYAFVAIKKKYNVLYFLVGAALPVSLTALYHYHCFGSVFITGQQFAAHRPFLHILNYGFQGLFYFHKAGFLGTFFSSQNGLFFFAPWLVFALPGFYFLFKKENFLAEAVCIVLVIISYFITVSGLYAWKGGWTVGPRYLAAIMPFMALSVLIFLDRMTKYFTYLSWIFVPCLLVSIVTYSLSSVIFPHFPDSMDNPFYEFLLGLVRLGMYPYNLGRLLGLGDWLCAWPYYLGNLFILFYVLNMRKFRLQLTKGLITSCIVVVFVSGLLFWGLSLPQTKYPGTVSNSLSFAERIWEP
jgi:hypothetical protein